MLSRNTYLEVDLKAIKNNIKKIIRYYDEYEYYFGVVKAECYGQGGIKVIKTMIDAGCNYLAVATLDEALDIRKKLTEIPILCLGAICSQYIETCIQNNITVTINSLEYLNEILEQEDEDLDQLKVHIKLNTGMNRLGINSQEELAQTIKLINSKKINLEGIYTHIYNASIEKDYLKQISLFESITKETNLSQIPIIHISASEALTKYEKPKFVNGCRLGIIMYGFTEKEVLSLETTSRLISEVVQIHELKKGETAGYNGAFVAKEDTKIAVVSIGYADGVIRKNTGREVYIHDKKYQIVGNICMDMLFVKVDDDVKTHDEVYILKNNEHIKEVAKYLETIPYEVICLINKRVTRIYKN